MTASEIIDIAGKIISGIAIPIVAFLLARLEHKSKKQDAENKKREKSRFEYDGLVLEGLQRIGDLSNANAKATLSNCSDESIQDLTEAQKQYAQFREKTDTFTSRQAIGTL